MQEGAVSTTHIQDYPPPNSIYSTISSHNYNFRVLTSEFHRNTLLLYYTCFLWIAIAFSTAVLLLSHSLRLQPYPFFVTLAVALIPLNGLAIYKRRVFDKNLLISSVFLNIIIIALAVLLSLQLPYSGVAFGVYLAAETICNCLLMQNTGKVLIKMMMLVQLLIICLKMDETVTLEWNQTLFGFVIIFFFLIVAAVSIFAYSLFISSWCLRQNCYEIKRLGLRFLSVNMLSICSLMAIPIWAVFINDSYHVPSMVAVFCTFLTPIFSFFKRTEIALFLCKTLEMASKDEPLFHLQNKNPQGMPHLFRVSGNWFVEKYDPSTCESELDTEECVACMDSKAETVWQPCGHCTLCDRCMHQLLSTQITNCPLCKGQPSSIVRVARRDQLSDSILCKNEFQIAECIEIRHF